MTLFQLLNTRFYRGNKSLLASDLKINRRTLTKYLEDIEGVHHKIVEVEGSYEFYANFSNKIDDKKRKGEENEDV